MMKRLSIAALAALFLGGTAYAQSSPGFVPGQVPTATQWNGYFAGKQDVTTISGIACDGGATDDATAINAALSGAANGTEILFPAGKTCVFKSTLALPHGKANITIDLNGSLLLYSGTDTTVDLIDLGDSNSAGVYNILLRNGRIWSSTFMTAGTAIHESYCTSCTVTGVLANKYNTTANTLWNAVQIDWPNTDYFDLDQVQAQNECFFVQGGGTGISYDVYWTHGRMGSCTHAAHAGGGFDNLNIDSTIITSSGNDFLDDAASTLGNCATPNTCYNQRINFGSTVSLDYGKYFPTQTVTIAAGGSGGTDSASCFVQTSSGIAPAVIDVTISGGVLTAVNHVHPQGGYNTKPTNPVSLATYAGTGGCVGIPTGATLNLNWTGGDTVYINDPLCTHNAATQAAAVVLGARVTGANANGIHVVALSSSPVADGQQCPLILKGGSIALATNDGILVDDANARVSMDSGTQIYKNSGYGVDASVAWSGMQNFGLIHDNTAGQVGANVTVTANGALLTGNGVGRFGTPVTPGSNVVAALGNATNGLNGLSTFAASVPSGHLVKASATGLVDGGTGSGGAASASYNPTGTYVDLSVGGTTEASHAVPTGSPPYLAITNYGSAPASVLQADSDPSLTYGTGDILPPGGPYLFPTTKANIYAITSGAGITTNLRIAGANLPTQPVSVASGGLASGAAVSGAFASGALVDVTNLTGSKAGGTAAASSVLDGGVYNSSAPTLTDGKQAALQMTSAGDVKVSIDNCVSGVCPANVSNASSGVATSTTNSPVVSYLFGFNGTTWDQLQVDGSKYLKVNCTNCSGSVSAQDNSAWTAALYFNPFGGLYQTSATSNPLSAGNQGFAQLTHYRALMTDWYNSSGTEMGTSGSPVQVSLANTGSNGTAVLVTGTGGTFPAALNGAPSIANGNGVVLAPGGSANSVSNPIFGELTDGTTALSTTSHVLNVNATIAANQSVNVAQVNGHTVVEATTAGVQKVGIVGNAGATIDAAPEGTLPTNGWLNGGSVTTAAPTYTTGKYDPLSLTTAGALRVDNSGVTQPVSGADPCFASTKTTAAFSSSSGEFIIVTHSSTLITRICAITYRMGGTAGTAVSVVSGSGSTCATSPTALSGSTTAANGLLEAQYGGEAYGSGSGTIMKAAAGGDDICILQSSTQPIAGSVTYVQAN